jgi:hypothetical protein
MAIAFLLTTPYALFSLGTFLHGDQNHFGGIFGARGLMFYNNFPPSLTEPFVVTSLAALNPLGLLLFVLSLVVLIRRRRPADILLLCFIVPFYLMLMYKSSPMLRHILPVLPFVFLACAAAQSSSSGQRSAVSGQRFLTALLGLTALTWFLLSLMAVVRMSGKDTRVMAEEWAHQEVSPQQTIALPTYFPYRYTPAIDSFHLLILDYDARKLDENKPDYLLMVEPEYRINGRSDDKAIYKLEFMDALQRNPNYQLYKRLAVPFGITSVLSFTPHFPTEDWNYPSPEILIYKRSR